MLAFRVSSFSGMTMRRLPIIVCALLCVFISFAQDDDRIRQLCPVGGIQQDDSAYDSTGIILTSFDAYNLWALDLYTDRRYPLNNAALCSTNCHLSPDFTWVTYWDRQTRTVNMMRLNGDERTPINANANEISWWTDSLFLIWTPEGEAYLQTDTGDIIAYVIIDNLVNVQPSGELGLSLGYDVANDNFLRTLRHITLRNREPIIIGRDRQYFNAATWSFDGDWFAFVDDGSFDTNVGIAGGEYVIRIHLSIIFRKSTLIYFSLRFNN